MLVNSRNLDLIEVGYTTGAHGVGGWLRVRPYFSEGSVLLHTKIFWMKRQDSEDPISVRCLEAKAAVTVF